MASFTAQILVGQADPFHGGITPTHQLFLSEDDRPTWILVAVRATGVEVHSPWRTITWIPSVENMLEDALVMIALHVIKDKGVSGLAKILLRTRGKNRVEAYEDLSAEERQRLYEQCRKIDFGCKLVLTVLQGSTIRSQVKALENYKVEVETCLAE